MIFWRRGYNFFVGTHNFSIILSTTDTLNKPPLPKKNCSDKIIYEFKLNKNTFKKSPWIQLAIIIERAWEQNLGTLNYQLDPDKKRQVRKRKRKHHKIIKKFCGLKLNLYIYINIYSQCMKPWVTDTTIYIYIYIYIYVYICVHIYIYIYIYTLSLILSII